jgi:hypothetical protein
MIMQIDDKIDKIHHNSKENIMIDSQKKMQIKNHQKLILWEMIYLAKPENTGIFSIIFQMAFMKQCLDYHSDKR